MHFSEYLDAEWVPALGCTEPASLALAAATAAAQAAGPVRSVGVLCDPRIYKNCYAVGIPFSQRKTGGLWAAALGSLAKDPGVGLEVFRQNSPGRLAAAERLIAGGAVAVDVDPARRELWIDCRVERSGGTGRAVIAGTHTSVVRVERNGQVILDRQSEPSAAGTPTVRQRCAEMRVEELFALARSITAEDRRRLEEGIALNLAIARHGETLFPAGFALRSPDDTLGRATRLVCGGVYARMSGEDFLVMSLAGSGNKGITATVPLVLWAEHLGVPRERMQEALALAAVVTSATTWRLGTLSAMCGCANAAGIGIAAGRVFLENGDERSIARAVNNMVGNVAGMICDGAKIGCGMKAMTAVDAASRSAELALAGMGIPVSDGIVGATGDASLVNLGRIAQDGMASTDSEILAIMRAKAEPGSS